MVQPMTERDGNIAGIFWLVVIVLGLIFFTVPTIVIGVVIAICVANQK